MNSAIHPIQHGRVVDMILGVVSNCWRTQLEQGEPLESLVAKAASIGLRAVELRQSCLGRYEQPQTLVPDAVALSEMTARFPAIAFNVALSAPFMSPRFRADDEDMTAGVRAAQAVANGNPPHLRLVDVRPFEPLDEAGSHLVATSIASLADRLADVGGKLSLENAFQPWLPLLSIMDRSRRIMKNPTSSLQICFDACNLVRASGDLGWRDFPGPLRSDDLSMVHVKQTIQGQPQPVVCDGDVDWNGVWGTLDELGYRGPVLFEIEPSDEVWDNVTRSSEYLKLRVIGAGASTQG